MLGAYGDVFVGLNAYSTHCAECSLGRFFDSFRWQFRCQHFELFDFRWFGEQLRGFGHQRLCDRSVEMRLPSCLIREDVKDAINRRTKLEGEPSRGPRLLLNQSQTALQKTLNRRFFSRLGM